MWSVKNCPFVHVYSWKLENIDFIMKTKSIFISLWVFYVLLLYVVFNKRDNNNYDSAQNFDLNLQDSKRILQEPCERDGNISFGDAPLKLGRNEKYNWSYTGQLHKDYKQFAPALNMTEYSWYIDLIATFKRGCDAYNISYMLDGGSVLGAYMYHGFVPWDDDFDIIVDISQKHTLKEALVGIPGYTLYNRNNSQWKFFSDSQSIAGPYGWNWPFIDIFFYTANETHFYDVTHDWPEHFGPRTDRLPIEHRGIFENMIMPVPHNMEAFLNKRYNMADPCMSNWWNHKTEKLPKIESSRIACQKLFGVYPFVQRFNTGNTTLELLTLGNKVLYIVETPTMKLLKL